MFNRSMFKLAALDAMNYDDSSDLQNPRIREKFAVKYQVLHDCTALGGVMLSDEVRFYHEVNGNEVSKSWAEIKKMAPGSAEYREWRECYFD